MIVKEAKAISNIRPIGELIAAEQIMKK